MVAIATYVVVKPEGRAELLQELFASLKHGRPAVLTIEAVDDSTPHTDDFEFHARTGEHDGYGRYFFVGFYFDENLATHIVNISLPPWETEPASLKLAPSPHNTPEV